MKTYNKFNVLLSASVPSKRSDVYSKVANSQFNIEEAVVSLSRNVFSKGGSLVFGGHPSISPLIAMVSMEFKLERDAENIDRESVDNTPIKIYQSRAYEGYLPNETSLLYNNGNAKIYWTDIKNNEKYNPKLTEGQCKESLLEMRIKMIESQQYNAMICLGGMEGVEEEFNLFRKLHSNKPIFLLKTTGGATSNLAERGDYENDNIIIADDEKILTYFRKFLDLNLPENDSNEGKKDFFTFFPYSIITAQIVKKIISNSDEAGESNYLF
jgi:hypothetical protein